LLGSSVTGAWPAGDVPTKGQVFDTNREAVAALTTEEHS
jgi:hypothetical protein